MDFPDRGPSFPLTSLSYRNLAVRAREGGGGGGIGPVNLAYGKERATLAYKGEREKKEKR
jgi:hypothetical protein